MIILIMIIILVIIILPVRRRRFWFWDSIVLLQTLALAASQVFATSLDAYFQVTIMLMVLVIGITVLAHCQPFEERLSQSMQVSCSAMLVSCSAMPVTCSTMSVSFCHAVFQQRSMISVCQCPCAKTAPWAFRRCMRCCVSQGVSYQQHRTHVSRTSNSGTVK